MLDTAYAMFFQLIKMMADCKHLNKLFIQISSYDKINTG